MCLLVEITYLSESLRRETLSGWLAAAREDRARGSELMGIPKVEYSGPQAYIDALETFMKAMR